ncbi:MAG: MgtC/SapB family protein [Hyphomicrobiaceae bacterium]|nr:MgtC/SapB family protein [Hyphomicrobiaceae bacterium]
MDPTTQIPFNVSGFLAALGIGLLIGLERERRMAATSRLAPGGLRTFTLTALIGAVAVQLGGIALLSVATATIAAFTVAAYFRAPADDLGLTSEVALVLTVLLGGFAMHNTVAAAAIAVVTTVLLANRGALHDFVKHTLSEREIHDGLVLATAALVVLPILPDQSQPLLLGINPRNVWKVAVLVMAVGALGHIALRALGAHLALPLVGFLSGFVSGTATIGAMGQRAKAHPELLRSCVAAATLSLVATFLQLTVVIGAVSLPTLALAAPALVAGGLTALVYGAVFTYHALMSSEAAAPVAGRAFDPKTAFVFAAIVAVVQIAASLLKRAFGTKGLLVGSGLAGLVDAHAAAAAVAALVGQTDLTPQAALLPITFGVLTNTIVKIVLATTAGGRAFAVRVIPGLVLATCAMWLGSHWGIPASWFSP